MTFGRGSIKHRNNNTGDIFWKSFQPNNSSIKAAILKTTDSLSAELYIKKSPKSLTAWAPAKANKPQIDGLTGQPAISLRLDQRTYTARKGTKRPEEYSSLSIQNCQSSTRPGQ